MNIGLLKDRENEEHRVALTPSAVRTLLEEGHSVSIECGSGKESGFLDDEYQDAGASIVYSRPEVIAHSELLLKVSPLTIDDVDLMLENQMVIGFLHLALADKEIIDELLQKKITAIGYEVIENDKGDLPVLVAQSEIAGQLSVVVAAQYLQHNRGGRGMLLGALPSVPPADVVILGAGTVGQTAARTALGLGASVIVLDIDPDKLRIVDRKFNKRVITMLAHKSNIEKCTSFADVLIGAILVHGRKTTPIVSSEMVEKMPDRSVIVDVAIDQGGCIETSRPTTLENPTYIESNVIHYCVPNMPSNVSRTASIALVNASLPYILKSTSGYGKGPVDKTLRKGVYLHDGKFINHL